MARDVRDATGRVVSRSSDTVAAYTKRTFQLADRASQETGRRCNLDLTIAWFSQQDGRWSPSTVRQYWAALRMAVEYFAHRLDKTELATERLRLLYAGPQPAARKGRTRLTSAKKRKTIKPGELKRLVEKLSQGTADDRLLANIIACNSHLALRPCEISTAQVRGDRIVIGNAKTTNGRSIGPGRELILPQYRFDGVRLAEAVWALVKALQAYSIGSAPGRGFAALSSRLARRCKSLGIGRICLYTFRHLGLATAKQTMSLAAVAALAGHASTRTATQHYARRRSGLMTVIQCARPTAEMVQRVHVSPHDRYLPAARKRVLTAMMDAMTLTLELPVP